MSQLHSASHSPSHSRTRPSSRSPTAHLGAHAHARTSPRPAAAPTSAPKTFSAQPGYRSRQNPPTRKALWAGGSVATLALLVIVPTRMNSQTVDSSSCQTVVRSGAEISRGQISRLLAVPEESTKEAVRQVVEEPYCLLPAQADSKSSSANSQKTAPPSSQSSESQASESQTSESQTSVEREAYPLAFDSTAWVVVNYEAGSYVGYDFIFKP